MVQLSHKLVAQRCGHENGAFGAAACLAISTTSHSPVLLHVLLAGVDDIVTHR